jgi:chemotaxis protein MotB
MSVKKFLKAVKEIENKRYDKVSEHTKEPPHHDESNWLVSYADMMTLLCGFFVMLFTFAKIDENQYEKVKEALSKEFNGSYISPNKELLRFATQLITELGIEKETTIKADATGVSIVFESTIFYDTLSADVSPKGKIILGKLVEGISVHQKKETKNFNITVEGHTDSRPIVGGIYPSNWELSGARASRVVRMFLDRGFEPSSLTAIGYADTRPTMPPRNADGTWNTEALGKNRRVVIRITDDRHLTAYGPQPATSAH